MEMLVPLVGVFMAGLVLVIPVAGLTLRFALKPVVEGLLKIRAAEHAHRENALLSQRVTLLEQQVQLLEEGRRQLEARPMEHAMIPPGMYHP